MKISLLTGGKDPHYALGLLTGLLGNDIVVEFVGNDIMENDTAIKSDKVIYHNLRGDQAPGVSLKEKVTRVLRYYLRLLKYVSTTDSKIFHILWLNKFTYFDRVVLNSYYKLLGKKLIFTAHNINIAERDGNDSLLNRLSLKFMYGCGSHIFVHTKMMKDQLIETYGIKESKLSVIPFGINNVIPRTELSRLDAKKKLRLDPDRKHLLFFGNIAPYKGLDTMIEALAILKKRGFDGRLIIAGRIKSDQSYWDRILTMVKEQELKEWIVTKILYIPDEEVELYYKSADVLILPYKYIFQSGVIFLSYSFGLPVIATDVGSLAEEIVDGKTGFLCRSEDPEDLADKIEHYFDSSLYKNLESESNRIVRDANKKYSWDGIGETTYAVYKNVLVR